ncbi:MAG TPA: acetylxylan esterase [Phycisphaerae bacterium]|nr:acetylxylan esterase [Phycisphaerae bacterium]
MKIRVLCWLPLTIVGPLFVAPWTGAAHAPTTSPVILTRDQDHERLRSLLHLGELPKQGANYDESKANPYPNLPDPLTLNNGQKVTTPEMWWNQRRPEIVELFDREIYGRRPKAFPKVTWEVIKQVPGTNNGTAILTKYLVGHVDNSAFPGISVNLQAVLSTPTNATGPVPVMMQFNGQGFGFPSTEFPGGAPARGAAAGPGVARGRGPASGSASNPGLAAGRGPTTARGPGVPLGPSWQQQVLAKGWGYALINTGSVQQDSGNGLQQGIIGLCNKGQPRAVDDWGVLSAWAWGASKVLDYFETDNAVNAKMVGLEGHSRWGKATLVAMAYDRRFAIAYVSSSGEGGAKLHRRNYGEPVDAVAAVNEYHWMAGNFLKYAGHWNDMPVDSHELIAMCAPRPVFIAGGTWDDRGADTKGMFLAAAGAGPVYKLLGKKDLGTSEMPAPDVSLIDGDIAFRQHEGGHTDALDWPVFLQFASRYLH